MSGLLKQLRDIHDAENPGVAPVAVAPVAGTTATLHINAATILRVQATLLSRDTFQEAAAAMAAELAALLRFDRVAIGFLHGRHVTVTTISGAADIKSRSEFADLVRAAALEDDGELGLLFDRSCSRAATSSASTWLTKVDFPEPETPVTLVSTPRGRSTSRPSRLLRVTPRSFSHPVGARATTEDAAAFRKRWRPVWDASTCLKPSGGPLYRM